MIEGGILVAAVTVVVILILMVALAPMVLSSRISREEEAAKARPKSITCPRRMQEFGPWDQTEGKDRDLDGRCSFCGSLLPSEFWKAVEAGVELVPTDKDYKVYVGEMRKFYFQHLSKEEKTRFVQMMNEKKLNIGYPGFFYRLPFFVVKEGKA